MIKQCFIFLTPFSKGDVMKKILLLACIFFAGLTLTAYAMEPASGDSVLPTDTATAPADSATAPAQPDAAQLLEATNGIYQITGEYVSLGDLAQQKPAELNKTARKFLTLMNLILICNRRHPGSFTSASDQIAAIKKAHGTLVTFIDQSAWHLPRLPFRRAASQAPAITPEQAREAMLAVALVAPRLASIVLPLLKCRCPACWGTTAALVLLIAIGAEFYHLGYLSYFG